MRHLLVVAFRRFWEFAPRYSWIGHLVGRVQNYVLDLFPVESNA